MIKINGTEQDFNGKSVSDYLAENGYDTKRVAVELNENILSKSQYEDTFLKDGDVMEVVSFVGGG